MTEHDTFDADRDPVLGAALRAALNAGDDAAFLAGVRSRMAATPAWWEVLGRWARPGLAAAVVLAALAGLWLSREPGDGNRPWDETLAAATPGTAAALLVSHRPPTLDAMLAAAQPR